MNFEGQGFGMLIGFNVAAQEPSRNHQYLQDEDHSATQKSPLCALAHRQGTLLTANISG